MSKEEEIKNELLLFLNKNVSSVIIEYLTPLPELPFRRELEINTRDIHCDLNTCRYYQNYYYYMYDNYRRHHMIKFYRYGEVWRIAWI